MYCCVTSRTTQCKNKLPLILIVKWGHNCLQHGPLHSHMVKGPMGGTSPISYFITANAKSHPPRASVPISYYLLSPALFTLTDLSADQKVHRLTNQQQCACRFLPIW